VDLDVVALSRAQFALTIMFHYLFPPLSIGLGACLICAEGMYLRTNDRAWESIARFFTRLFAVNFAVGVVTGIVMEFEFGTNWATYSRYVGDVFGSALASEGIFAFFLESGFLAILVFGWERVTPRVHFFSTVMVFTGSVFSAAWIVVANSWQQTPAGHVIEGEGDQARAIVVDFWAVVFNPSSMHRLNHVVIGALIVGGFFVMSIAAYYVLRDRHGALAQKSFMVGLTVATVASFAELVSGHAQAVAVSENQPAKLAAFEGHFHTSDDEPTGMYVFGLPDEEAEEVRYGIAIPGLLSFMVHGDGTPIEGLDRTPVEDRPPVLVPFLSYHLMAMLGTYFVGIVALAWLLYYRKRLFQTRWLMRAFVASVILPYVANEAGWVSAEVGRQPWVVYGLLRTRDAISPAVSAHQVLVSIILFSFVYIGLFAVWLFVMNEKIQHGPEDPKELETRASMLPAASTEAH
jgi:cytochrome d ubiquinol oxidase subunit I